jgi:hypothetical protein
MANCVRGQLDTSNAVPRDLGCFPDTYLVKRGDCKHSAAHVVGFAPEPANRNGAPRCTPGNESTYAACSLERLESHPINGVTVVICSGDPAVPQASARLRLSMAVHHSRAGHSRGKKRGYRVRSTWVLVGGLICPPCRRTTRTWPAAVPVSRPFWPFGLYAAGLDGKVDSGTVAQSEHGFG